MSWQFTVGLRVRGKADRIVVDAEDALIAALKAKADEARSRDHVCAAVESTRRHASPTSHSHRRPLTDYSEVRRPAFLKEAPVTYIVNESWIRCKYTDCVEVCQVTVSARARTCWSSIPTMHRLRVASRNARWTLSSRT